MCLSLCLTFSEKNGVFKLLFFKKVLCGVWGLCICLGHLVEKFIPTSGFILWTEASKYSTSSQHSLADLQARRDKVAKLDHGEIMNFSGAAAWFLSIPRRKRSKRIIRRMNAGHAAPKQNKRQGSGVFEKRRISQRNMDHAASKQIKRLSTRISHKETENAASRKTRRLSTGISHKETDNATSGLTKRLDSGSFESYLEWVLTSICISERASNS